MELRTLRYFLAVAQEENITKAANQLHISQPSLSRQLMQMEEELGVRLFIRSKHRVILTDEGRLLRRRAQEIVALAVKAEKELAQGEETVSGEIAIGCGETKNIAFLSQLMISFREQYPEVSFDIYTAIADDVKERIENGILDFGILMEPVEISKYHFIRMPLKEKWYVLMRKDCPLAEKQSITPQDLIGVPIMIPKRQSVRNELENWFGDCYDQLDIVSTYNLSYSNRSIMVENQVGVCLVHEFENNHESLCLRPINPEISNSSVLVWKKNQIFSPAVTKFIEHVKKCNLGIN
ncbi:MAG: LysR family transcriptional regulator [Fusicatenibacter sp.]|nr:LysR family transcriptional regulator [Lachnospiraceae bacterium]MDY2939095.1 LysR family transcriptional regulator [Fusicatenibacter sp.]